MHISDTFSSTMELKKEQLTPIQSSNETMVSSKNGSNSKLVRSQKSITMLDLRDTSLVSDTTRSLIPTTSQRNSQLFRDTYVMSNNNNNNNNDNNDNNNDIMNSLTRSQKQTTNNNQNDNTKNNNNAIRPLMKGNSKSSASVLRRNQDIKNLKQKHTKTVSSTPIKTNNVNNINKPGYRNSMDTQRAVKRNTGEYQRSNILFKSRSHHSQIFPVIDPVAAIDKADEILKRDRRSSTYTMNSLPVYQLKGGKHHLDSSSSLPPMSESNTTTTTTTTNSSASTIDMDSSFASTSSRLSVRPGSSKGPLNIGNNGNTSRTTFSSPLRRHYTTIVDDDDRSGVIHAAGHRIGEGDVNFNIVYDMLTGIRYTVSSRLKNNNDPSPKTLTSKDFSYNNKLVFDRKGSEPLQNSILTHYEFKFKDYAPRVFRELRKTFGVDEKAYLESLTSKYVLNELNSPGKSGSFFYYSRDYKYIIKTIHHSEHTHLRKTLERYYNYVRRNPNTLICQFYGLHRIKLPITFQTGIKNKKVYFIVMNNLFPPDIPIDTTFDLKGSLWGRYTKIPDYMQIHDDVNTNLLKERSNGSRIILKDLNWLDQDEKLHFDRVCNQLFVKQLKNDVDLLSKLNTMDYSLLVGVHFVERPEDGLTDFVDNSFETLNKHAIQRFLNQNDPSGLPANLFTHFDGGLLSIDTTADGCQMIYFIGIIDCLTNYSIVKRLETFWRGINHKLDVVSAIPPKNYANRFYKFIENSMNNDKDARK